MLGSLGSNTKFVLTCIDRNDCLFVFLNFDIFSAMENGTKMGYSVLFGID